VEFVVGYVAGMALIGGGIGYLIGQSKGLATVGFCLGALLGFIGWIIVAVMEPSPEERLRRDAELVSLRAEAGVPGGFGKPMSTSERPCPFCAEMIKPAAILCRCCGRDVPAVPVQAVDEPSIKCAPSFESVRASYATVFAAVWEAAQQKQPWPAAPERALADACRRMLQGQSAEVAVYRAFPRPIDAPGFDGPAY
jgi:hypothetical protein